MARLPQPGGDNGNWGNILNDYLGQSLNSDGLIKDNAVTANTIAPNSITGSKIASDAISTTQIADNSISSTQLSDGSVVESKLSSAVQTKLNATPSSNWSSITNKPAVIAAGSSQYAARSAISAAQARTISVDDYGADSTGAASSDAGVAAAIATLGSNPGIIEFGIGTYQLNSSKVLSYAGQYYRGQGIGATVIDYRGNGPALKCWDSTVPVNGLTAPGHGGGVLGGMTINGFNNTNANTIGLQIGDLLNPVVENVRIINFVNSGSIGFLGQNRYSWSEYGDLNITSSYNTNCFIFESHPSHPLPNGGKSSWSYNTFDLGFSAEANQNGVILRNKVDLTGIHWTMSFNCNPSTTNTGVAITVGINSTDDCHIDGFMSWFGESTTPGAIGHKDINIGSNSGLRGYGALVFNDFSAAFIAGTAVPYRVVFAGRVNCPSLGHYSTVDIPFVTIGDPGRFGALGDSANYVNIEEGANGGWPQLQARGPSNDIGINLISKGYGSVQANGFPIVTTPNTQPIAWNSPGVTGQIGFDSSYMYICVSTNVWKRVALTSF